jgi:hypothetical protein
MDNSPSSYGLPTRAPDNDAHAEAAIDRREDLQQPLQLSLAVQGGIFALDKGK